MDIFTKILNLSSRNPPENDGGQLILIRLQNELELIRERSGNVEVISVSEDLEEWIVAFKGSSSSSYEGVKVDFLSQPLDS